MPYCFRVFHLAVALCFSMFALSGQAAERIQADRLVITFKEGRLLASESASARVQTLQNKLGELNEVHGHAMTMIRPFGERGAIVALPASDDVRPMIDRLESDPLVESVAVDRRINLNAQSPLIGLINALDPFRASRSWFHRDPATQPAGVNTASMWARFHGTSPTVVAVLDTGVLPSHPMLQGHLLPGYDFVADPLIGADGQSSGGTDRDADPTDPGDGVSLLDIQADSGCGGLSNSSWHGTFVSGLIAGNPIPAEGIFSLNWNASILPVRVLGRCGGFSTDLADAIRWAAGLPVAGAPANPFPARVINLSLGAQGACVPSIEGAAIQAARNAGALVVVATGNRGSTVDSPANCPGAFGVAAIDQEGLKASYSNFGPSVQLMAPGGDGAFPIWSASNSGVRGPLSNTYNTKTGTSFSAPMVAAAASLYLSLQPSATVAQVESLLRSTSRPFLNLGSRPICRADLVNTECNCTAALCGAGMLDIFQLVQTAAVGGLTNLFSNAGNVIPPGTSREFSSVGSTNAQGQEVGNVSFDIINVVKSNPQAADVGLSVNGLLVDVSVPQGVQGFGLRSTVAGGRSSVVSVSVADSGATSPTLLAGLLSPVLNFSPDGSGAPAGTVGGGAGESGSGIGAASAGGGGGSVQWFALLLMACLLFSLKMRKQAFKRGQS